MKTLTLVARSPLARRLPNMRSPRAAAAAAPLKRRPRASQAAVNKYQRGCKSPTAPVQRLRG